MVDSKFRKIKFEYSSSKVGLVTWSSIGEQETVVF